MERRTMHRGPSRAAGREYPVEQVSAAEASQATLIVSIADTHLQTPDDKLIRICHMRRSVGRPVRSWRLNFFTASDGFAGRIQCDIECFDDQAHGASGCR